MEQPTKKALLIMDMQSSILERLPDAAAFISNVNKAITKAVENEIPVIYVVVGFRSGTPEISSKNKSFSSIANHYNWTDEFVKQWLEIHPGIIMGENPLIVTKRRISAFTGSDLEVLLRGLQAEHLLLAGVSTSGVVLSTIREAADKDYILTVLKDCCADPEPETHRFLTDQVFPRQGEVITVDEWVV